MNKIFLNNPYEAIIFAKIYLVVFRSSSIMRAHVVLNNEIPSGFIGRLN
jgi:hypothetical protein